MKLDRLASTTQSAPAERRATGVAPPEDLRIRRVEAMQAVEGDRERSLQQEMAEIPPQTIADFDGGDKIREEARDLAAQVAALGGKADGLLRAEGVALPSAGVDESV